MKPLIGVSPSDDEVDVPNIVKATNTDPGSPDPTGLPRQRYQEVPQELKDQLASDTPGEFSPVIQTELPQEDPLDFALPNESDVQFDASESRVDTDLIKEQDRFDTHWLPPEQPPVLNYGLSQSDRQLQDYISNQQSAALSWQPAELPFELGKKLTPLDPSVTGGFEPTSQKSPWWGDLQPSSEWNPLQGKFGDFGKGLIPGVFQAFNAVQGGAQGIASDVGRGLAGVVGGLEGVGIAPDLTSLGRNMLGIANTVLNPWGFANAAKESIVSTYKVGRDLPNFAKGFASTFSVLSPVATGQKPLTNLPANNVLQKLRNQSFAVSALTGRNLSASDKVVDSDGRFNPLGQQRESGKRTGSTLTRKFLGIPDDVVLEDEQEVGGFIRGIAVDVISGEAAEKLVYGTVGKLLKRKPSVLSRTPKKTIDITSENPNGVGRRQLVDPNAKVQKLLPPARPDRIFVNVPGQGVIEYKPLNPKKIDPKIYTGQPMLPGVNNQRRLAPATPMTGRIPVSRRLSAAVEQVLQPRPRMTVVTPEVVTPEVPRPQLSGEVFIPKPGSEARQLPDGIPEFKQPQITGVSPTTKLLPESKPARTIVVSADGKGVYVVEPNLPKPDPIAKRVPKDLEDLGVAKLQTIRVIAETIPDVEIIANVLDEIPVTRRVTKELVTENTRLVDGAIGDATDASVVVKELPQGATQQELPGASPDTPRLPAVSSNPERTFEALPSKGLIDTPSGLVDVPANGVRVVPRPDGLLKGEVVTDIPKELADLGDATRQFDYNPIKPPSSTQDALEGVPVGKEPRYGQRPFMRSMVPSRLSDETLDVDLWKPFTEAEVLNVQRPGLPPMSPTDDATVQALLQARYYQPHPGVLVSEVAEDAVETRAVLREAALTKADDVTEDLVVTPIIESPVASTIDAEVFAPQMSLSELAESVSKQQDGAVYNPKMLVREQRTLESLVELAKRVTLPNGQQVIRPETAKSTINTWTKFLAKVEVALNAGGLDNNQVGMFRKVFARSGIPIPDNFPKDMVVRINAAKADGTPEVLSVVRQPSIPLSEDYGVATAVRFDESLGKLVPVDGKAMKVLRTSDIPVTDKTSWFQQRLAAKAKVEDLVEPDLVKDKEALVAYQAELPDDLVGRTPIAVSLTNDRATLQNAVAIAASRLKQADVEYQKVTQTLEDALAKLNDVPDASPQTLLENPLPRVTPERPVVPTSVPNVADNNETRLFHGTRVENLDLSKVDPIQGGSRGELGTAIYLTRDVVEAEAKAVADVTRNVPPLEGRTFGEGSVHEVVLKPSAKLLDANDKLSASAVAYFQDSAFHFFGDTPEGAKAFKAYSNLLEKSSTTYLQAYTKLEEALLKASKAMYGEASADEKLLLSFQRDVNRALRESGVDGITNGNTVAVFRGDALTNVSVTPWKDTSDTLQVAVARYNSDSISAARTPSSTQLVSSAAESKIRVLSELQEVAKRELDEASSELDDTVQKLIDKDTELTSVVSKEKTERLVAQEQSKEVAYQAMKTELNKVSDTPCL